MPIEHALLSLRGLTVGDAFGELFFSRSAALIEQQEIPPGPWLWTDE